VALMWLRKKLRPAHQTLANVRRDPLESRRDVWRTLTRLCKQLDLFGGELVVSDGSQFRAVNAKGRHVTKATWGRYSSVTFLGAPGRGASFRPSAPSASYRVTQVMTVCSGSWTLGARAGALLPCAAAPRMLINCFGSSP
jgi:hypothetical protein